MIDAGNSSLITDQRDDLDLPRNNGGGVDIGSFENNPVQFVVDTTSDVNDGNFSVGNLSLREALSLSSDILSTSVIAFDPVVFNGEQEDVIRLQLGSLVISEGVIIDAGELGVIISGDTSGNDVLVPGSNVTDVLASETGDRLDDNVRVINITAGDSELITLIGLTITGGDSLVDGGGIQNDDAELDLKRSVIVGNRSLREGGGIFTDDGQLRLNESVVSDNFSERNGGGISPTMERLRSTTAQS